MCAVQWAVKLFPFDHVPARYICVLGAGDVKVPIREEAHKGLAPPQPGADGGATAAAAGPSATYPAAVTVLAYLRAKIPKLRGAPDLGRPLLLPQAWSQAAHKFTQNDLLCSLDHLHCCAIVTQSLTLADILD